MSMKRYEFTITLVGHGETPAEAWQDVWDSAHEWAEEVPDEDEYTVEEMEDDEL